MDDDDPSKKGKDLDWQVGKEEMEIESVRGIEASHLDL